MKYIMIKNIKQIKNLAIKSAKGSGKILMKNYGKVKYVKTKKNQSYFSNVDLESEKYIISNTRKKFPDHDIVSEESGRLNKKSDYRWYIDPLDGTHNYINKIPLFGVSIALEYKGEIIFGVINLPFYKEIYFAEKGKGSFLNNKRIKVSNISKLSKSFILADLAIRYKIKDQSRMLKKFKRKIYDFRSFGCAVSGYTMVANGNVESYITHLTNSWDVSAGALIVEEAGGKVTNHKGEDWKPNHGKFIASNNKIHNQLLKLLK